MSRGLARVSIFTARLPSGGVRRWVHAGHVTALGGEDADQRAGAQTAIARDCRGDRAVEMLADRVFYDDPANGRNAPEQRGVSAGDVAAWTRPCLQD